MEQNDSIKDNHKLNTDWIIWYHAPNDKNWGINSYKSILEIKTLEDFLVLYNSWDICLPKVTEGMFFIMRKFSSGEIIYPRWEDKNNINGGYWSFKIGNDNSKEIWDNLTKLLIGEVICSSEHLNINGISISPKKNFCIIKIWNKDSKLDNSSLFTEDLKSILKIDEVKYSSHNKNIKRDMDKINKYKKRPNHGLTKF